ncbi:vWA domain-containing protein [Methylotenera sp.]|uniref:vWA domain-containing protein n=1 Tax=Methylotenera sp. TaxID=2051956 RepID=UPI002719103C|nr:vWA domain-containing protein [Methylotenera sp.]MDO9205820.1 vWA domain-containing protein [Methylotenera sp.]MDO9205871.1 vWA domain-containing protein [Methylotenera sp.]MDO9392998.1 vWA domain-containing protein [Methylotenera sp.]MDP1522763.1 vWA domain-containing protein [Methylotenera sp.]MDP2070161.1 vWA domain-containing protein [Methylotenera sp.]
MIFTHPLVLWLLPLALLPILLERSHTRTYSWVYMLPHDPLSNLIGLLLKILAAVSLFCIILGLASPHSLEQKVERIGVGAQIGMVIDRSASMDDPFAGGTSDGRVGETKSVAASRLMTDFVNARQNDMIGVITFSNSGMYVLPLTESREAILAAIKATAGNSLFQTNIGGGLTSAVSLFENVPDSGSRAIILISDGAGRMSGDVQQKLREWLQRYNITLYWIVLRQPGGISIFNEYKAKDDSPLPSEIELYEYFKTLRTPFSAYEAEDPKSLAAAISDINQKERKPIKYMEKIPGHDFTQLCYIIAALMIALLLSVKYLEVRTWRSA